MVVISMNNNMKQKNQIKNVFKIIKYVYADYKVHLILVAVGVIVSSIATVLSSLFIKTLIDDYIVPMLNQSNPDYMPLARAIFVLMSIMFVGILFSYMYARLMVIVTQGTMNKIRNTLFTHMETLPIKYFDTHKHGDIMSVYTNDVDTLRQFISQTMVQFSASFIGINPDFIKSHHFLVNAVLINMPRYSGFFMIGKSFA